MYVSYLEVVFFVFMQVFFSCLQEILFLFIGDCPVLFYSFAYFKALYLELSDILLVHTHTHLIYNYSSSACLFTCRFGIFSVKGDGFYPKPFAFFVWFYSTFLVFKL